MTADPDLDAEWAEKQTRALWAGLGLSKPEMRTLLRAAIARWEARAEQAWARASTTATMANWLAARGRPEGWSGRLKSRSMREGQ